MNYIIFDLEWNQSFKKTCYLEGEIIQIGAVKLDDDFQKIDTFKINVTPQFYTILHRKVKKLTNLNQEDLQYGFPFPTAIRHFRKWCGECYEFLSWGNDDIRLLRTNLLLHDLDTEWLPPAYDLQLIFDKQITKANRQYALLNALKILHKKALTAHDALHDALNTYAVAESLDMKIAITEYNDYRSIKKENIPLFSKELSMHHHEFSNRKLAYSSFLEKRFFCPHCGRSLKTIEWVVQTSDKHITLANCSCGKEYFMRIRLRKNQNSKFRASFSVYELDQSQVQYYAGKRFQKLINKPIHEKQIPLLAASCTVR